MVDVVGGGGNFFGPKNTKYMKIYKTSSVSRVSTSSLLWILKDWHLCRVHNLLEPKKNCDPAGVFKIPPSKAVGYGALWKKCSLSVDFSKHSRVVVWIITRLSGAMTRPSPYSTNYRSVSVDILKPFLVDGPISSSKLVYTKFSSYGWPAHLCLPVQGANVVTSITLTANIFPFLFLHKL